MPRRFSITAVLIILSLLAGCQPAAKDTGMPINPSDTVKVLVSILPQADFVKSIGGSRVEVTVLIPPGASPEDYEMSPRQIQKISEADIYFTVGSIPFEQISLPRISSANPDMPIINTSEDIMAEEQEHHEGHHHDPHVWLSPSLVKEQVQVITRSLIEMDPEGKDFYEANLEVYIRELGELDLEIKGLLADRHRDDFLIYHPAWGYFAADYGLHEIAVEKDGKEPTAQEMMQIITAAREKGIKNVIGSPQHSARSAEAIASQLQGQVKVIDPLPADYIAGMGEAAQAFKEILTD